MKNLLKLMPRMVFMLAFMFISNSAFSQVRNFHDWSISASDLTANKVSFTDKKSKPIHITVNLWRYLKSGSTEYESVNFAFKLGRIPKENPTVIYNVTGLNSITTTDNDFPNNGNYASISGTIELNTQILDDSFKDGDKIVFIIQDPTYPNGRYIPDKTYLVSVSSSASSSSSSSLAPNYKHDIIVNQTSFNLGQGLPKQDYEVTFEVRSINNSTQVSIETITLDGKGTIKDVYPRLGGYTIGKNSTAQFKIKGQFPNTSGTPFKEEMRITWRKDDRYTENSVTTVAIQGKTKFTLVPSILGLLF